MTKKSLKGLLTVEAKLEEKLMMMAIKSALIEYEKMSITGMD